MSRILLHGTSLLKTDARAGIPRVVHELTRRAPSLAPAGTECLVLMRAPFRCWVQVGPGLAVTALRRASVFCARLWRARRNLRLAAKCGDRGALLRLPPVWMGYVAASALRRLAMLPTLVSGRWIRPGAGDILVLLDYDLAAAPAILAARQRGAQVVAVVYDLLPITHPECFMDASAVAAWLEWLAGNTDHLLGISHDVEDAIRRRWPDRARPPGHFLLGADFAPAGATVPSSRLAPMLSAPCFLMVGTLEPRKGHGEVLDAFEVLWARGGSGRLLIVGREGWLVDGLIRRLRNHAELGRRLHWFNDVGDTELSAAYQHATALIAASRGEGFGLPLVEAQLAGLPVIATDIPVFREVGGPAVRFYPPGDIPRLVELLEACSASPPPRLAGFRWRSWQEAAADFMSQVTSVARD